MITLPLRMVTEEFRRTPVLLGAEWEEVAPFYAAGDPIRQIERASIRAFMVKHRAYLKGRVMDFGAGEQPYRDLVDGEYCPFEKGGRDPGGYFDAVMCNQVVQYLDDPKQLLAWGTRAPLKVGGHLVMTYPTNWAEVETEDLWRFTKAGMERLLREIGFTVVAHELRAAVAVGAFQFPLGYGVIARR